jgi:hypothetical protein
VERKTELRALLGDMQALWNWLRENSNTLDLFPSSPPPLLSAIADLFKTVLRRQWNWKPESDDIATLRNILVAANCGARDEVARPLLDIPRAPKLKRRRKSNDQIAIDEVAAYLKDLEPGSKRNRR